MSTLTVLNVRAPAGNGYTTPQAMQRVDDHLRQVAPAMMKKLADVIIQEPDGTWEVRVLDPNSVGYVKFILTKHYGLEIANEQEQ